MKAKFKFWTGTEMLTEGFFINADGTVWAWVDYRCTNSFVLKGDLIQYTGLKDKNGKEIYESDIDQDGGRIFYNESIAAFQIDYGGDVDIADMEDVDKWMVVSGNIYESPELLDQP